MPERPLTILEFADAFERTQLEKQKGESVEQSELQAIDRMKNGIKPPDGELTEGQQEMAAQMARVIRSEPLHTKGPRQFRIDTEGRQPIVKPERK